MKTKSCARVLFVILFILIFNIKNILALQIKNIHIGDTASDRWIEVYNDGDDIEDFTTTEYRIIDNTSDSKRSIIEMLGGKSFPKDSTAFIYKTLSPSGKISESLPANANLIFRSSFVLDKNGGYIQIAPNNLSTIYTCTNYGGISCPESPSDNTNPNNNSSSTNSTSTNVATSSSNEIIKYIYVPINNQNIYGDIKVLLPEERIIPAAAESLYTLKAIDGMGRSISPLDFHWSFGDGGEKFGKDVSYTYIYPGEYTLIATADGYTSGGQARMNVKVVNPDLKILRVGLGDKDNVIDLQNNTEYDLFLSGFKLRIDGKNYMLPKNLLIAKNKTIHLSGEALGFKLPAFSVSLLYPNENILTDYISINNLATDTVQVVATETLNILNSDNKMIINISDQNTTKLLSEKISESGVVITKTNFKKPAENIQKNTEEVSSLNENTIQDFTIIKRLVLENDLKNVKNYTISNKVSAKADKSLKSNDKNVDTGVINWLKSLIY